MKLFKEKKQQSTSPQPDNQVDVTNENVSVNTDTAATNQNQEAAPKKKKMSKLKILSIIWTIFMFGFYIFKDVMRIREYGWDAVNIITTAFLAVQIILFVVFTAMGAKDKTTSKKQKTTLKWVKKIKKLSIKLTTFVTSILIIMGADFASLGILDIVSIAVAGISLLLFVISLIKLLVMEIIKWKVHKKKEQLKEKRMQAKAKKNANKQ